MLIHHFCVLCFGAILDLLLGDPHWMPHPVRWMGWLISALEKGLRTVFPSTKQGTLWAGRVLVLLLVVTAGGVSYFALLLAGKISPWLRLMIEIWFTYQLLAARSLQKESIAVFYPLVANDLPAARQALSRIVGRDTQELSGNEVACAAVETVAENTSDGVIAPMLYLFLGGLPLGMIYKAINTMDSMVGYQNERYLYFGRAAAKLDDVVNWIPARLAGVLMCGAAFLLPGFDGRNAWSVFLRDRFAHKSPNSAHTEAACAGALGIQLGGPSYYFCKLVEKPTMGDPIRPVEFEDIKRSCTLMYGTAALFLLLLGAISLALFFL